MLDVDNAAAADQAPSPSHGTARRAGARRAPGLLSTPGPERPVLFGGIAAAVVLGLLIGFLTAPSGHHAAKAPTATRPSAGQSVSTAELAPAVSVLNHGRHGAGTADNIPLDGANRLALRYAYYQAYADGRLPIKQPGLRAAAVTIPKGSLFYGVVEGATPATDVYWAAGPVFFADVGGQDPAQRHEWRRVGASPWQYVGTGCAAVPTALRSEIGLSGC